MRRIHIQCFAILCAIKMTKHRPIMNGKFKADELWTANEIILTHYLSHKILYIYFFNFWKNRAHHFLMKWTNSCNWHQMLLPFAMLLDKRDQIYLKGFNWKSTKNPPLIIKSGVFYKKLLASVVSLAPKFIFFKEKKIELPLNWNRHLMQLLNWGVSEYLLNYLIARFRCICDLAFSLFWMM